MGFGLVRLAQGLRRQNGGFTLKHGGYYIDHLTKFEGIFVYYFHFDQCSNPRAASFEDFVSFQSSGKRVQGNPFGFLSRT